MKQELLNNLPDDMALIRLTEVKRLTGLSRTTIYRRVKDKTFPQPAPLSDSSARRAPVAWSLAEVKSWIRQRLDARYRDSL